MSNLVDYEESEKDFIISEQSFQDILLDGMEIIEQMLDSVGSLRGINHNTVVELLINNKNILRNLVNVLRDQIEEMNRLQHIDFY